MIATMKIFLENEKNQVESTVVAITENPEETAETYKKEYPHVYAHVHTYKEGLEGRYTISL